MTAVDAILPGGDRRNLPLSGWAARAGAWAAIGFLVLVVPLLIGEVQSRRWSLAVIFAIVGLSLNVLIGHAGQTSLGHQGFLGMGAFTSAYLITGHGQVFWAGVVGAALVGAATSALMGLLALRVKGLYFALITLVYGRMAEESLFNLSIFGSGAGIEASRPSGFEGERAFYYLCVFFLILVMYLDWRFTTSKAGRAVAAIRENEQVASSYAIPVGRYKLVAFTMAGLFVGVAGALFASRNTRVVGSDFDFNLALLFVIVTVVGGIRSRAGIVVWTSIFQLLPEYLVDLGFDDAPFFSLAVGALVLVIILVKYPGGVGQLIQPATTWLAGGPFRRTDASFVAEGVVGRP